MVARVIDCDQQTEAELCLYSEEREDKGRTHVICSSFYDRLQIISDWG